MHSQGQVIHGPDTPEHFRSFSLEQVSNGVQCGAPMLYELMQTLGDTRRNVEDDEGMTGRNESADVLLHFAQCSVMKCKWNPTAPEFHAGDPWYYQAGRHMFSLISVPWFHHSQLISGWLSKY